MSLLPPRLTELIRRDLGARHVELVTPEDVAVDRVDGELTVALPHGHTVRVEVDPDADQVALQRRLETIVSSFWETLTEALPKAPRPNLWDALHRELAELVEAAGAVNAVVIDAMSSVTWAEADAAESVPHVEEHLAEVIPIHRSPRETPPADPPELSVTERAIESVRRLPAMAALSKGGQLTHHERDTDTPYVAKSFASIYVLLLVFDAPFDELRAERAIHARLETIDRLVVALPPLDPTPIGGAKAIRARRS